VNDVDTVHGSGPVVAIHGGAGTLSRGAMSAAQEGQYHGALREVLLAAQRVLADGGSAIDAVCVAVDALEDCELFNAGRGAVFTRDGTHELDAALMDGSTLRAGAVGCVSRIARPLRAARAVKEQGDHVLLVGAGAEAFAQSQGLAMTDPAYFSTETRRAQLKAAQRKGRVLLDHDGAALAAAAPLDESRKFGTVGAVAVDRHGHVAAATSTGGMTNKRPGRVGDTPLIGAGTYADDRGAAVSCTGTGEMFIRTAAAYDLCARIRHAGRSLAQAAHEVVHEVLPAIGGNGGLIAVDAQGNLALPFNSEGMYRGWARVGEAPRTAIFR
jgi:beta-aspartyl-peptidase (threonine type)